MTIPDKRSLFQIRVMSYQTNIVSQEEQTKQRPLKHTVDYF